MGWYLVITEEMRTLGLSNNELMVYAVIAGYSQKGQGCYYGSQSHLASVCGISQRSVASILSKLTEQGLLVKTDHMQNGMKFCSYESVEGYANFAGGMQTLQGGYANFAYNNNIDNKDIIKEEINKEEKPQIKKAILLPYSSAEFVETWEMLCRQPKWKTKSADALKLSAKKLAKYPEETAIRMMQETITAGWQGLFELKPVNTNYNGNNNRRESAEDRIHLGAKQYEESTL